ncbi:hypothetical protein K3M67_05540 [Sphingobium sp. V4]|uniref:NAD(P)H-dependent amine dehydrogenase family protein n=1 Tax=Sphingobium sp. V4 TaxID=3038927 RepID=UPI002557F7A8|nr:hypothetical protein [Sphingobium sp. V4]WIW89432.1 hypothetical protein K3M67_05540 [Sphingobium sp. V4]
MNGIVDRPIRAIVWGPGNVGGGVLREILKLPEYELVGVLTFGDSKVGLDAGELAGAGATGVIVTNDRDAVIALDADVVFHTPMTTPADEMDGDVVRLLRSGKNVVSATSYHYPPLKGADYVAKLEAACRQGNASLHGTGIHPNFFIERLGLTLTGICTRIKHMKFAEIVNNSDAADSPLRRSLGYGMDPADFVPGNTAYENTRRYYEESLQLSAVMLFGERLDRIEYRPMPIPAKEDLELPKRSYKKGTIAEFRHIFVGYIGDEPKLTMEECWHLGEYNSNPYPDAKSSNYYKIEIEGEPCSLSMELGYCASIENGTERWPNDPTQPPYYATAVTMLQAAPIVCAAAPGLVYPKVWAHYASDLRTLASGS